MFSLEEEDPLFRPQKRKVDEGIRQVTAKGKTPSLQERIIMSRVVSSREAEKIEL